MRSHCHKRSWAGNNHVIFDGYDDFVGPGGSRNTIWVALI